MLTAPIVLTQCLPQWVLPNLMAHDHVNDPVLQSLPLGKNHKIEKDTLFWFLETNGKFKMTFFP